MEDVKYVAPYILAHRVSANSPSALTQLLEQIPVPLDYRRIKQRKCSEHRHWSASGVCKILRNQTYLGHTVQGKTAKLSLSTG